MNLKNLYAPPTTIPKPEFKDYRGEDGLELDAYHKAQREYEEALVAFVKERSDDPLAGEEVSTGVADGYARYLVMTTKPLRLMHIDTGDAWHAPEIWLRGLRVSDVRQMAKNNKDPLFGRSMR